MSNSLLKHPSGWYLRPPHLQESTESVSVRSTDHIPAIPTPSEAPFVTPEEEFYIRECCPVTLNHLLPDLYLTQKHHVKEFGSEFDVNMQTKFEKHLEDSHRALSCCSSTGNEELEEETNLDRCIENDINMHILQHAKLEFGNKMLLKPHKVNYPDSSMSEWTSSGMTLNNDFSMQSNNETFSSIFPRAKIVPKILSETAKSMCSDRNINRLIPPLKSNKHIQPIQVNKGISYSQRKSRKPAVDYTTEKQNSLFSGAYSTSTPRIEIDSSFAGSRSQIDVSNLSTTHLPLSPQYSPSHASRSSLCVYHRRSRSLSPFKTTSMRSRSPVLPECTDSLVFPSPHLLQLARLKREELKLEEKMLLRQRQRLEVERLKPPIDRWYEMKNYQFHQEAHRHNASLRNENILPLIHERRRQLMDALKDFDS